MRVLYVKLHEGPHLNTTAIDALKAGWGTAWAHQGFKVMGWGRLLGDPVAEARLAHSLCRTYDLDGYIANAEVEYEGPSNFHKSREFTREFRRLAPNAPLALSGVGSAQEPWVRFLDYAAWRVAGAFFMPQVYTNEWPNEYSMDSCMAHAVRAGWDLATQVIPTIGVYGEHAYPVSSYIRDLITSGTWGFNVYLGESLVDDEVRLLGKAIRENHIAEIP